MSEYQLQIKQVVDYPRCRIYRQFVQSLMADRSIRTGGGSWSVVYLLSPPDQQAEMCKTDFTGHLSISAGTHPPYFVYEGTGDLDFAAFCIQ